MSQKHSGLFLPCPHCDKLIEIQLITMVTIPKIKVKKVKEKEAEKHG